MGHAKYGKLTENTNIDRILPNRNCTGYALSKFSAQTDDARPDEDGRSLAREAKELERAIFLLEQIKDLTGVGAWELRLDPPELTWSEETKRIHEVPSDYKPALDTAIEFYAPEARPIIQNAVEKAISHGNSWDLELPLISAKGNRLWVRALGSPVYDDGGLVSLIGAFQDITKHKLAEERILLSEANARKTSKELRTVVDAMHEGVSVFGPDGRLTVWNDRYIDIFRKGHGEVRKGVNLRALLELEKARGDFEGSIDDHLDALHKSIANDEPISFQFRTKSGRIIHSTHAPLPDGGWVGTHSDITEQVLAAERDERAARHDPLTGLPNRLGFNAHLDTLTQSALDKPSDVALLLIDLDRFKDVNDTHGHQVGDALLVEAGERFRQCVGDEFLVARLGGDEFAIVVSCEPNLVYSTSVSIARSTNAAMKRPFEVLGKRLMIGASVGISTSQSGTINTEKLFQEADQALYKVKGCCRGSFHVYDQELAEHEQFRSSVKEAVKAPGESGALEIYFQPIFNVETLEPVAAEALLRWNGQQSVWLSPIEVIKIAEENAAMDILGGWVLRESIKVASGWPLRQCLSVNVSPSQLGKGILYDKIVWALEEYSHPASLLEIEITESVFLKDATEVTSELHQIQSLGVKVALDDFGTGFASLEYLRRFPFDRLKIPRSFLPSSTDDHDAMAILRSISNLASDLAKETTVEGIETDAQLKLVQNLKCGLAQGFYLAKPMPAAQLLPQPSFLRAS